MSFCKTINTLQSFPQFLVVKKMSLYIIRILGDRPTKCKNRKAEAKQKITDICLNVYAHV